MVKQGTVLVCDVCGHEWLSKIMPARCAKCKSSKWNRVEARVNVAVPELAVQLGRIDVVHATGCRCYICKPPKE